MEEREQNAPLPTFAVWWVLINLTEQYGEELRPSIIKKKMRKKK
jgi:hypothetical protein